MVKLTYQNTVFECRDGESILDALMRQGVTLPFSCRSGICQVCLQRCTDGEIPKRAQHGLKQNLVDLGYFMPCCCMPTSDLEISPARNDDLYQSALIHKVELLAPNILQILIEPSKPITFRPGQFINVRRTDGLTRSYSIAGIPEDYFLELHVQHKLNGLMSHWLYENLKEGDEIEIQGPQGDSYFSPSSIEQPLLLIGTGTGLAPLLSILRSAITSGHQGPIHLYHGTHTRNNLYRHHQLIELANKHANFHYHPCVTGENDFNDTEQGRCHEVAFQHHQSLNDWGIYLCGLPQMVSTAEAQAIAAGALENNIHCDPFEMKDLRSEKRAITTKKQLSSQLSPDPEMWQALNNGELLHKILFDFYTTVYGDPKLSPFFTGVTKQRLVEKQYLFLRQHFTGEKIYFGDRPRNAHHWMVISDELFEYRESLMHACLAKHGLPSHLISRFLGFEEKFRADIVKSSPWPKVVNGIELPLDGFDEIRLSSGSLCDSCGQVINIGELVRYHVRLGTLYCPTCMGKYTSQSGHGGASG